MIKGILLKIGIINLLLAIAFYIIVAYKSDGAGEASLAFIFPALIAIGWGAISLVLILIAFTLSIPDTVSTNNISSEAKEKPNFVLRWLKIIMLISLVIILIYFIYLFSPLLRIL